MASKSSSMSLLCTESNIAVPSVPPYFRIASAPAGCSSKSR